MNAVKTLASLGIINGEEGGQFSPSRGMTRAEAATIVNHMLGRSADKAYADAHPGTLKTFPDVKKSYWAYYDILEAANTHDYTKTDGVETRKATK